ncbi:MAG: bis(5'-nucleosyl)-tetraphosphatase (symmetrical), partial [Gammaproteobacteria bacterium]
PWRPWFDWPNPDCGEARVIFGHWSTVGRIKKNNVVGLDSGCVWGGQLSAIQIDRDHDNIVAEPCKDLTEVLS